jgi:vacuolar-type H+-ATPase subunit C/Vma6
MNLLARFASREASPYTIIRVGVMRTKLFTPAHYHQFMHMGIAEMIQRMQESDYAEEISAYTLSERDPGALAHVLTQNLARTMEKLRRICDENARRVVDIFAMREDFDNLRSILRGMRAGFPPQRISVHLRATGILDDAAWTGILARCASPDELLDALAMSPHAHINRAGAVLASIFAGAQKDAQGTHASDEDARPDSAPRGFLDIPLARWEHALERAYDTILLDFIEEFGGESVGFDEFFVEEIDGRNILTLFKLTREGVPGDEIMRYLSPIPGRMDALGLAFYERALKRTSVADLFLAFQKTPYATVMREASKEYTSTGSLSVLEILLARRLLRQSMTLLHRHPLSVDVILGFLIAKRMEIRNLNCILRAKTLMMDDADVERLLVVEGAS